MLPDHRSNCTKFAKLAKRNHRFSKVINLSLQTEKHQLGWLHYDNRVDVIIGYTDLIEGYVSDGWTPYLFSITFRPIPGSRAAKIAQMTHDIGKIYSRLATRVVRKPTSPNWAPFLPKGFFVPDLPVPKKKKDKIDEVTINDGLHFHGILVTQNWQTRLDCSLDRHFKYREDDYIGATEAVRKIHVQPIKGNITRVVDYTMKSLKRGRFTSDDVILFPKVLSEVRNVAHSDEI